METDQIHNESQTNSNKTSFEKALADIRTTVLDIEAKLISLDIKGSFEADDEVGFFFIELKNLSKELTKGVQDTYDI